MDRLVELLGFSFFLHENVHGQGIDRLGSHFFALTRHHFTTTNRPILHPNLHILQLLCLYLFNFIVYFVCYGDHHGHSFSYRRGLRRIHICMAFHRPFGFTRALDRTFICWALRELVTEVLGFLLFRLFIFSYGKKRDSARVLFFVRREQRHMVV